MSLPANSHSAPVVGLIHATLAAVQPMIDAFRAHAPEASLLHFLDEGLLAQVNREGLTAHSIAELERLVHRAEVSGANGILLTCSSFSPAVPALQKKLPMPVVSVDEAMLRAALAQGSHLGVVATVEAAGPITANLLREYAAEGGRTVAVDVLLEPAAFSALKAGDGPQHDELVRRKIEELLPRVDVIVLAQISMARAIAGKAYSKPVLTSPRVAVEFLMAQLRQKTLP